MPLKFVMSGELRSSQNIGVGSALHEIYRATQGQTHFALAGSYTPGTHELIVLRNGTEMTIGEDYDEIDEKTVAFVYPLDSVDIIKFRVNEIRNTRLHQEFITLAGQTVFNTTVPYHVGINTLQIYDEGLLLRINVDYTEVDEYTVKLLYVPDVGAKITIKEIV
jgi:hypothetical protein